MFRRLLPVLIVSCMALLAEEQVRPMSYYFAEPTMRDSKNSFSDTAFLKLIDGAKGTAGRVAWCVKDFRKQPVKIEFSFGGKAKFSRARIYYHRGPRSYGLRHIKVFGSDADGAPFAAGNVVLNQPYVAPDDRPRDKPEEVEVLLPNCADTPTDKLVVEIASSGSYIALQEIEFFGVQEQTGTADAAQGHPYASQANRNAGGLQLRQDGDLFILENDAVLYVIDPGYNGCVNFAYDKAVGKNFVKYANKDNYGGMFNDRFWPGGTVIRDMYRDVSYQCEVLEDKPERKALRLTATGKSGFFANVTIAKTFSLTADSPVLQADYKISNDQANVIPLDAGLWLMGGVTDSGRPFELIYPGALKIERNPSIRQSLFCPGAVRGWTAMLNADGQGLAFLTDFSRLNSFYFWSNDNWNSTLECRMGVYSIEADSSLEMSFALAPFHSIGLPTEINRVAAASLGLPGESIEEPRELSLSLLPFFHGDYTLKIAAGLQQGKKLSLSEVLTHTGQSDGRPVSIPYQLKFTPGTWVVQATLSRQGKEVFAVQDAVVFRKASGVFAREPESEKRPETGVTRPPPKLNFNSLAYETEHIKWSKPYAGKKPKVLLVCRDKGGIRDTLEVAQRCEMDLTTNFIGGIWRISGQTTSLNLNDCFAELQKLLKDKFDCLLVTSDIWKTMPNGVRDAILLQVESGSGLVLIAPEGLPAELDKSFALLPDNKRHFIADWTAVAEHPITAGVPFAALPPTRALKYSVPGTVLAKVGEHPLLGVFNYGQGKVAGAAWATDGRERDGYYLTYTSPVVLPVMLYNPPQDMDYHYWEYHISLLAKMIYWVSGSQTNVQGSVAAEPGLFRAELTAAKAQTVQVLLNIRDKSYALTQELSQEINLKPGKNAVQMPFQTPALGGWCFADCQVKSEAGVEWWGTAAFMAPAPVRIASLELPDKVWKKDEPLTGTVTLSGPAQVRLTLADTFGNVFARGEGADFSLPLQDCRTYACQLLVEVLQDGAVVDRRERTLPLFGRPDERVMQVSFGWPSMSSQAVQLFLTPYYLQIMRDYGANAMKPFKTDLPCEILLARATGLPFVCSQGRASSGGKFPYDTSRKAESKFDLLRKPCLSEPGFKNHLEEDNALAAPGDEFGVIYRAGPDESNSIGTWEGCFSPACQQEFRRWLEKTYGSLEALNQSWCSDFQSWDQVLALTSDEVRDKPSYAPWLDHRTFNDWNRADAIARIVKGIKRFDPSLRYALSGTQEPKTFNAWEWYGIMQSLDAVESYIGEQTVMQRCFSRGRFPWSVWLGYDTTYDSMNARMLSSLFQGATGFCIYSGRFYVNPDYTLPKLGKDLQRVIARYKDGFAECIMNAESMTYPIAFYYSPASIKLGWLLDLEKYRLGGIQGARTLLEELNLTYDYVASAQVEESGAVPQQYRVLYLALTAALSPREVSALREFVSAGGTLIAELSTGMFDAHGKPYPVNQLAEVFGLQAGKDDLVLQSGELQGLAVESWPNLSELKIPVQAFNRGIVPAQASVLAQVISQGQTYPGITAHKFGRGQAILLAAAAGSTVSDWAEMRYATINHGNLQQLKGFWQHLLQAQQISPLLRVPTLTAAQVFARTNGPLSIVGIVRNTAHAVKLDPKAQAHQVQLAQKYHVYDFFAREYLGLVDEFTYTFGPETQAAFVLLPYRPEQIRTAVKRVQDRVTLELNLTGVVAEAGEHLYRIRLQDPSGKINPAYDRLLFAPGGQAEYTFVLPLNAPAGKWQAQVEEMLSACKATAAF